MRSLSRGSRALARCAISAVAVACPLIAATAAQAAIAGANPPTQTIAPDLRSVSLIATNEAVFCFDKTLSNAGIAANAADFELAGYNSITARPATSAALDVGNTNCVVATFDPLIAGSSSTELKDYSIGTVLAGAVTGNAGGTSLADSVPETSSTSHSGTAGVTTGPNLVSVTADASLQQIDYVFDRPVDPGSLNPSNFGIYNASGANSLMLGTTATVVNGNQVNVGGFGVDVRTATVADVGPLGGNSNASGNGAPGGAGETSAPITSLPVAGTSGTTVGPVLISAAINSPNTIDFTFDKGVGTIASSPFLAYASNGSIISASGAIVTGADTVRATFPQNVQNLYEEFVHAAVPADAVSGANNNPNIFAGVAVGGNVGAFATGFTNAPDARSLKLDNASGTATVDFDQRVDPTSLVGTDFVLHAADGSVLAAASGTPSLTQGSSPSDAFIALQFTPQELAQAAFLEIQAGAVSTFGGSGFTAAANVQQIIAASAPASAFRAPGSHVHSVVRVSWKKHGGGIFAAKPHKAAKKHKSH